MAAWWSWLLMAVGVLGLYYAGKRRAIGWAIGLGAQILWIAYAIATRQWGFIAVTAIGRSLPCFAGVRFLPRLKAGVSSEVSDNSRG